MPSPSPLFRLALASAVGLCLAFGSTSARAAPPRADRSEKPATDQQPMIPSKRLSFHLGYYGELALHPGGFAGVEWRVLGDHRWDLLVTGNVASYVHPHNHVGLEIYPELGTRLRIGPRVGLELLAGVGYLHTFLAAPIYEVDDAGGVDRIQDFGRPSLMPTASLGVSVADPHVSPFMRIQTFGQYPFNQSMLAHVAVLAGVRL